MHILSAFVLVSSLAFADTVTFRDGSSVNGTFLGGDSRTIRLAVGERVDTYPVGNITAIRFGTEAASNAPAARAAEPVAPPVLIDPATPPARRQQLDRQVREEAAGAQIPNGTTLTVRMVDSVDSERDSVGMTYRASLDEPVQDSSGRTLVPRGADVLVKLVDDKQSGKIEGRTVLTLDLVSFRVNGRDVEIDTVSVTQESASRTARSGKVIGGTAALGAIIGAIAGGGKGAAIGAGAGAGVGTVAQVATKGQRVRIPSETRLTFTLQQAVRL